MKRDRSLDEVLRVIAPLLNEWELFYVVVNELAKRVYGFEREFTNIELLVNLTEEEEQRVRGFFNSELLEFLSTSKGTSIHRDKKGETTINVIRSLDQFDMQTIGRRVLQYYSYSSVFVVSIEDMVLREVRNGERRNMKEAVELYSYWRNHLDISYMVRTSRQFGFYDRFIKMKKRGDRRR